MVFSSYIFIFAFLPLTLVIYFLLSKIANGIYQRVFLILSSLFFYGYQNSYYLFLILTSIVLNYLISYIMVSRHKVSKAMLIIGVIFNVVLIGYFKYFNFFIDNVNYIFNTSFLVKKIMLPLGISFFTFQQLSFLISIYKGEHKPGNFKDYCLFVVFFPQLVAGPIVLYDEMIPQFEKEEIRFFNVENFSRGVYIFSIGLFKKAVVADTLAVFVNNGFAMKELGLLPAWVTSLSYMMQLYFDFSGYCDMALGIGRMFNISLPVNFDSPYKSASIREFWRRWHITLGRALGSYVYRPLGGSRKGIARTCFNLILTFLVSGLWHGAEWTFVAWGGVHGLITVMERVFERSFNRIPHNIRVITTFISVNILWVLFRADNFENAISMYRGMINVNNIGLLDLKEIIYDGFFHFPTIISVVYIFCILTVLIFIVIKYSPSHIMLNNYKPTYKSLLLTLVLFCISLIFVSRDSVFIYFNF